MKRPWYIWIAFGLAVALAMAGMVWVTVAALRADRAQREARRQAALESDVSLALWRMDSRLASLIAEENARPYFAYSAFYPAEQAYNRMFQELRHGEVLVPSPLLTTPVARVRLYFQFDKAGELASPQAPTGNMLERAITDFEALGITERIERAEGALERFRALADRARLLVALTGEEEADALQDGGDATAPVPYKPPEPDEDKPPTVRMGVLTPLWLGEELVLARSVEAQGGTYVQGLWLDWPGIRDWLVAGTRDILPEAALEPVAAPAEGDRTRMLSVLPVRLAPGPSAGGVDGEASAVRIALIAAWCCAALGVAALGVLLFGAISLGERRGSFVSAVTHELRTPITTLQMYTEMLSEGMVTDEAKRQRYLDTLSAEAVRLGHLVENVLAYSRLERGRRRRQSETFELTALLDHVAERLAQRAQSAGMSLEATAEESCEGVSVRVDVSAIEQILLNLVDNCCKYAVSAEDRTIHLDAGCEGQQCFLRVRDHGPGIARSEARKLFRPFSKSAHDAAHSAPGVGLGLALSRRLARDMRGDLVLEPSDDGASFSLRLPST